MDSHLKSAIFKISVMCRLLLAAAKAEATLTEWVNISTPAFFRESLNQ